MTTRYAVIERREQTARTAPRPAQRRTRRRVKKRRHPLRLVFVLLFLGAFFWFVPRSVSGALAALRWQESGVEVQDGTVAALWRMSLTDSRVLEILNYPEAYPPALLDLLAGNSETIEFVADYPEHHADAPAETLTEPLDTVPLLLQWDKRWYDHTVPCRALCGRKRLLCAGAGDKLVAFERRCGCVRNFVLSVVARPNADRHRIGCRPAGDLFDAAGRFYNRRPFYRVDRARRQWRIRSARPKQRRTQQKDVVV